MTQVEQLPFYDENPLPNHPGIDSNSRRRPAESFKGFQVFVNTRGLKATTVQAFNEFLVALFEKTGNHWMPGFCMWAVEIAAQARESAMQYIPGTRIAVMFHLNQLNAHIWTRLEIPNQPTLVIDPAGVYNQESRISPYFGLVSPCIIQQTRFVTAERVYTTSIPLSPTQENGIIAANKKYFQA